MSGALHNCFFSIPDLFEICIVFFAQSYLFLELCQPLPGGIIFLLRQSLTFNLQLDQSTFELIERLWLRVDFHADSTGCLID